MADVVVRFNDPGEFCDELRRRGPNLEDVLRLTRRTVHSSTIPIRHLSVIATYFRVVSGAANGWQDVTQVVALETYCGQLWGNRESPTEVATEERAESAMEQIRRTAAELGYEVAAGVYEAAIEEGRRG